MATAPPLFPGDSMKEPFPAARAEEARRVLEERVRILVKAVEQSPVSIIVTDNQGNIQYVNPKFCQVSGYAEAEVLGKTPRILKSGLLSDEFYRDLWRTILAGEEWHGVFQNRTKSGDLVWELASISPIRDDRGVVTHFVGVKEDFTEMKRLQDRMDNLAHHDQLTGLPNRTLFQDRLRQTHVLARRRGRGYALFYLDLDGFKGVNDNHGHERGDRLLQEVARRVSACVRETDTVARVGGDEFMVILADLQDRDTAASIARLITEAVIGPMDLDGVTVTIGVSIGISFCPRDADDPDRVVSCADAAMYRVKNQRKNGFAFWEP